MPVQFTLVQPPPLSGIAMKVQLVQALSLNLVLCCCYVAHVGQACGGGVERVDDPGPSEHSPRYRLLLPGPREDGDRCSL